MEHSSSQEINLEILLLFLVRLFNKNRILILIMSLIFAGVGMFYYHTSERKYESSMMLRSDILTEAYSNTLTDNLKKLIDQDGHIALAEKLNISSDQAAHLVNIEVKSVEASGRENVITNVIFLISVEVTANSILPDLETGLIDYLENNEYVKKRVDIKRQKYLGLIDKVRHDIAEMDSLKKKFLSSRVYSQETNSVVFFDPTEVYTKMLDLYKEEFAYLEGLELLSSIQLIEGFTAFDKPTSPKRLKSIAVGLIAGFILSILVIGLREFNSYLKKLDKAQH